MQEVIIIGGGLAGLSAANHLHKQGISFKIIEASDRVGGRVKTDIIDGFRLDHGFQVLLTAYPETQALLDYKALNLKQFVPGAVLLQENGKQEHIGDPLRDFSSLFPTIFASVGGLGNKFKILSLKNRLAGKSIEQIFAQKSKTSLAALREDYGFSEVIINRFFKPFFSGIFLETELNTDRRMFDFVFKMFGEGYAAVPNSGMEEIPKQLAANLPADNIFLQQKVTGIEGSQVFLESGETLQGQKILLATQATGLVKDYAPAVKTRYVSTTHLHFISDKAPLQKGIIALNTKQSLLVNNICVINKVAPGYASGGKHLISLSVVGKSDLQGKELNQAVRKELKHWFGNETEAWEHLHTRVVEYALPEQKQVRHEISPSELKVNDKLYVCGDFLLNGSINAAMKTGRLAAQAIFS